MRLPAQICLLASDRAFSRSPIDFGFAYRLSALMGHWPVSSALLFTSLPLLEATTSGSQGLMETEAPYICPSKGSTEGSFVPLDGKAQLRVALPRWAL